MIETNRDDLGPVLTGLNLTQDKLNENIETLKEWMQEINLPEVMEDNYIMNFIMLCKGDLSKTKDRIRTYYSLRKKAPEFFKDINPRIFKDNPTMNVAYWLVLPKLTNEKYRVHVIKVRNEQEADKIDPYDMIKMFINLQELRLKEDIMHGDIYIADWKGAPLRSILRITPYFLSRSLTVSKELYSLQMKGFYLLNCPTIVSKIMTCLRIFLKPKLFDRIHIYKDDRIIESLIPKEILPRDFGGDELSVEELREIQLRKLHEYADRFDELDALMEKC